MRVGKGMALVSIAVLIVLGVLLSRLAKPPANVDSTATDGGGVETLEVFCAAGVKPPIVELAEQFAAEYGVGVNFQYGGSGTLLSSLQVARRGDLFIAADVSYVEKARAKGIVAEILPVAKMTPVIAVSTGNPKGIHGIEDLLRDNIRVALGNPDAAAIGKVTCTCLEKTGMWEKVRASVEQNGVFKPTVPEVANDVKLQAVDAGIIWDATANQYPEIDGIRVDALEAGTKRISVGVLTSSLKPTLALRFARYLNSVVGNRVFSQHRYAAIDGDAWDWQPEVTFFCGAVNKRAVDSVINRFQAREGVVINTVYNGCGILTAQMRTIRQGDGGAGFPDTYMACDRYYLDNVADWFQDDVDVSEADIVIAVQKGNPRNITGLQDLTQPGVRVSVGQPEQCTIGALTRALLKNEGVHDAVMRNVVTQAASSAMLVPNVTTKSVDAALAYITDTKAQADDVDVVRIPSPLAKAVQPFSVARSSKYKHLGRRLFEAVAAARENFEQAGFNYLLDEGSDSK